MEKRLHLNKKISIKDFKDFYWLKKELIEFCKNEGLKTTGEKIETAQRIEHYRTPLRMTSIIDRLDYSKQSRKPCFFFTRALHI